MYRCSRCGSDIDDGFDRCWHCREPVATTPVVEQVEVSATASFKVFRGARAELDALCGAAAHFATTIGPDRLITVAQSADQEQGIVTVWFWDDVATSPELDASTLDPG